MTELDPRRQALKDRIIRERGYFGPMQEGMLRLGPEWVEMYLQFVSGPWNTNAIPQKTRELIYIAVDVSITHLYERGLVRHYHAALKHGTTPEEIYETIELAFEITGRTCDTGVGVMVEEFRAAGRESELQVPAPTAEQAGLKREFIDRTGHWPDWGDFMLGHAPDFTTAYLGMLLTPHRTGALDPKTRAFIGLALHAAPTTADREGTRRHMRAAIRHGASAQEIVDILQLAAGIGMHNFAVGLPLLFKEMESAAT